MGSPIENPNWGSSWRSLSENTDRGEMRSDPTLEIEGSFQLIGGFEVFYSKFRVFVILIGERFESSAHFRNKKKKTWKHHELGASERMGMA